MALILLDKSVWPLGPTELVEDGDLCLCTSTRLELLNSAHRAADLEQLRDALDAFPALAPGDDALRTTEEALIEMATTRRMRVPAGDLLIAACALTHGARIAHHGRTALEALAPVVGVRLISLPRQRQRDG